MEEGNFSKSWGTICEINQIEGHQVNKKLNLTTPKEIKRSNSKITMQIADLYRELLKKNKQLLPLIDQRYQELDKFLSTNPSYVELHQYFKRELTHYNLLQKSAR
jgi:hypothetical protein